MCFVWFVCVSSASFYFCVVIVVLAVAASSVKACVMRPIIARIEKETRPGQIESSSRTEITSKPIGVNRIR